MNNKTVIYLFGSNGLIGSSIQKAVESSDFNKIFAFSRKAIGNSPRSIREKFEYIDLDLSQAKEAFDVISSLYNKYDNNIFIFSAWQGTPRSESAVDTSHRTNLRLIKTYKILASAFQPSQILLCSTSGALCKSNIPLTERTGLFPETLYAKDKLTFESEISKACLSANISLIILRMSSVSGFLPIPTGQGIINQWAHRILQNKPIDLYLNKSSTINLISSSSIGDIVRSLINSQISGVYNIASNNSVSLDQILKRFVQISDKSVLVNDSTTQALRHTLIDNSKLKLCYFGDLDFKLEKELDDIYHRAASCY